MHLIQRTIYFFTLIFFIFSLSSCSTLGPENIAKENQSQTETLPTDRSHTATLTGMKTGAAIGFVGTIVFFALALSGLSGAMAAGIV